MRVYSRFSSHEEYLRRHSSERIVITDDPKQAEVLVSDAFTEADDHDALKAVVIPFTAHDKIDIDYMKRRRLALFNTTVHAPYVAERALQLMLSALGRIVFAHTRLKQGQWRAWEEGFPPWQSLYGKRVGIYGYGRIGRTFARLIAPFAPEIFVIDRGKDYPGVKTVPTLEALVETCDIVLIAAPLNRKTEGAFDQDILSRMEGGTLVNIGRGKIIEEKALYEAARDGTLAAFASDVWYEYPEGHAPTLPSNYPLHTLDNVVMSPHCGGMAEESRRKMLEHVQKTLEAIAVDDYSGALDLERLV